jgi:hypothetical protein
MVPDAHATRRAAMALLVMAAAGVVSAAGCTEPNPAYGRGRRPDATASDGFTPAADRFVVDAMAAGVERTPWDLTTGLIGYWRLDDGGGGYMASDASGMGHHGTLEGMDPRLAWVQSPRAMALEVPDVQEAGVRVPLTPAIDNLQRFTIAAWTYRTVTLGRYQVVLSRQVDGDVPEVYSLAFHEDTVSLLLTRPSTTSYEYAARAPGKGALNRWLHVAATFDGNTARLYVDGTEVAVLSYPRPLTRSTAPLYLGTNKNPTRHEPMSGRIDEVLLYSVPLPAGAIAALAGGALPPAR